ncbi:helix-turn-helix domain-containing protein [Achromobacter ruhlandii]|uniref:helix-turn-helix domain-containing protein n=1 Tax=Achromobacter ruhlandii TaxID=72557 RepID=UPI001583EB08|nr:helix-turn-helix transcriptional regulator [Achromobacter ruhlandii]
MTTLGQRLKAARRDAKLTQAQVAKKVGMSQSALSELESDAYPTSSYTPRLAHLYRVHARWLADGEGPREIGAVQGTEAPSEPWPFSRIDRTLFDQLPQKVKDDIEDYIEMKIVKASPGRPSRTTKSAA